MKKLYYPELVLDHDISFEVHGKPVAMPRARHARVGNFVRTYTPEEAVNHKALVGLAFKDACRELTFTPPLDAAISLDIVVTKPLPASAPRWQHDFVANGGPTSDHIPVTTKPDWDNYGKLVSDALNGLAYRDDGQVFHGFVKKVYGRANVTTITVSYFHVQKRVA